MLIMNLPELFGDKLMTSESLVTAVELLTDWLYVSGTWSGVEYWKQPGLGLFFMRNDRGIARSLGERNKPSA